MGHFGGRSYCGRLRSGPLTADKGLFVEPSAAGPSREEIARLAHSYWEARGGQGGSAEDDWLRAEQELKRRK